MPRLTVNTIAKSPSQDSQIKFTRTRAPSSYDIENVSADENLESIGVGVPVYLLYLPLGFRRRARMEIWKEQPTYYVTIGGGSNPALHHAGEEVSPVDNGRRAQLMDAQGERPPCVKPALSRS